MLAGWGLVEEPRKGKHKQPSSILMQAQVPVVENESCKQNYKRIGKFLADVQFDDGVMCAGFADGGASACLGDSGGPLMLPIHSRGSFPYYQIGIVSHGVGCGRPNIQTFYASVIHYLDWIQKQICSSQQGCTVS